MSLWPHKWGWDFEATVTAPLCDDVYIPQDIYDFQ